MALHRSNVLHFQFVEIYTYQYFCVNKAKKKKKGLSHRLLPKKLSATLFFFFFFLGKIAMLMRFFF